MNDWREQEAQRLFWEVEALRGLRASQQAIAPKLTRMARLHEERARELLGRQDADGGSICLPRSRPGVKREASLVHASSYSWVNRRRGTLRVGTLC